MDVSDHLEIENKLDQALQKASSEARKSLLLSSLSKGLRGPINGVRDYLDMMSETDFYSSAKVLIDKAKSSSTALEGFLRDVLDYALLDSKDLKLNKTSFDLRRVLENCLDDVLGSSQIKLIDYRR